MVCINCFGTVKSVGGMFMNNICKDHISTIRKEVFSSIMYDLLYTNTGLYT